jgi:hypothetical protein
METDGAHLEERPEYHHYTGTGLEPTGTVEEGKNDLEQNNFSGTTRTERVLETG